MADENIIKRRLLIEGESCNDDRRFTLLLKNFLRWISTDESEEDSQATYQSLLISISQCELAMEQAVLIQAMNFEQSKRYDGLFDNIGSEIEVVKQKIVESREQLKEAKVIRKNRQEYHNLAKIIQEHPNRQETLCKINKLKLQLAALEHKNLLYEEKIRIRKKQFHLFLVALRGLQKLVDQDDSSLLEFGNVSNLEGLLSDDRNNQMDAS